MADRERLQRGVSVWSSLGESRIWIPLVGVLFSGAVGLANSDGTGHAAPVIPPGVDTGGASFAPTASGSPQDFFESVKGLVFPLKTALGPGDPKRSYGTAFVVDPSGILATNFHVVSDVVSDPGKYGLFLEVPSESDGGANSHLSAEILALDIIHDLALVKVERQFKGAFKLPAVDDPIPSAAERVWSLGKPLDLSMALVEGNFNGEIRIGDYAKFFLSTPINQGMSGGPTVDTQGVVRGVNYAILNKKQNVSFAVPGRHLAQLIATYRAGAFKNPEMTPPGPSQRKKLYRSWLEKQISDAGNRLVEDITSKSGNDGGTQRIRGESLSLAELPGRLKCWQDRFNRVGLGKRPGSLEEADSDSGSGEGQSPDALSMTLTSCNTDFSVDIGDSGGGREVGDIHIGMLSLKSSQPIVTPRDWKLLGGRLGNASSSLVESLLEKGGSHARKTLRSCRRTPVKNGAGLEMDLGLCVFKHEKSPSLLDAVIRISGGLVSGEAFALIVHARGFAVGDIQKLSSFLLEGLRPEGAESSGRQPASAGDTGVQPEAGGSQ